MDGSASPKKSLGQHWLRDEEVLREIVACAQLGLEDVVLEIGPGLGTLTKVLSGQAAKVVAVEFDPDLARKLQGQSLQGVEVIQGDFLNFDLENLPHGYKIVVNIPYYITGKIVRKILESRHQPSLAVLLTQKEVAQRLAARPGGMSALSAIAQYLAEVSLGPEVAAEKFTPPPKVDSQVVILRPKNLQGQSLQKKAFLRVVKAGFSARRKKLHAALSGGLAISVDEAKRLLQAAEIDSNLRAQNLSVGEWARVAKEFLP